MERTDKILADRGSRYGNYLEQATLCSGIRWHVLGTIERRGMEIAPDQHDALYMISVKLSRIANGDPNYADNWRDIAGYATLVADRLEDKSR
jgi:hypothetical protein